jgi:IS1 family transposase
MTDGHCVYANFIDQALHLVMKKTKMTRIKGENTRLKHYLARLHRATLCYSKSLEMLRCSVRLLMHARSTPELEQHILLALGAE